MQSQWMISAWYQMSLQRISLSPNNNKISVQTHLFIRNFSHIIAMLKRECWDENQRHEIKVLNLQNYKIFYHQTRIKSILSSAKSLHNCCFLIARSRFECFSINIGFMFQSTYLFLIFEIYNNACPCAAHSSWILYEYDMQWFQLHYQCQI